MTTTHYRDTSIERRERAAACVERHIRELSALLVGAELPVRVVEGSAVAAEVFLANTNTLHTAVRVAIFATAADQRSVTRTLTAHGFARCEPAGDATLLRMAASSGLRAVHVLFDGASGGAPQGTDDLHPGDPAAARARAVRLGTAWLDLIAAHRRVRHSETDEHETTESFEVQVIEGGG